MNCPTPAPAAKFGRYLLVEIFYTPHSSGLLRDSLGRSSLQSYGISFLRNCFPFSSKFYGYNFWSTQWFLALNFLSYEVINLKFYESLAYSYANYITFPNFSPIDSIEYFSRVMNYNKFNFSVLFNSVDYFIEGN